MTFSEAFIYFTIKLTSCGRADVPIVISSITFITFMTCLIRFCGGSLDLPQSSPLRLIQA